jgi:hypothetical protein
MLGLSQVAVKQLYDREVHQEEAAILSSLSHRRGLRSWLCACVCVGVYVWVRRRRCAQSACGRGTYTMRHRHHAEWAHDSMQKQRMMSFRGGARHRAEAQIRTGGASCARWCRNVVGYLCEVVTPIKCWLVTELMPDGSLHEVTGCACSALCWLLHADEMERRSCLGCGPL